MQLFLFHPQAVCVLTCCPLALLPTPAYTHQQPLSITLKGITNDSLDPSVDTWRTVALPLLRKAGGLDEATAGGSLELRVVRRGARPAGGGEVQLRVPLVRALPRVVMTDEGMVKRVRGISYSMKVRGLRCDGVGWWIGGGVMMRWSCVMGGVLLRCAHACCSRTDCFGSAKPDNSCTPPHLPCASTATGAAAKHQPHG